MFTIEHIEHKNSNKIVLKDLNTNSSAAIRLDLGGSLQKLVFQNTQIIKNSNQIPYQTSFASAILFPFANRIQQGTYSFQHTNYTLELNENNKNALHGLIYNQNFKFVSQEVTGDSASITLSYLETHNSIGFPYSFEVFLTYKLTNSSLNLKVAIKNTSSKTFPFTLGWHPYFYSSDLYRSFLRFKSSKKIVFDKDMIPETLKTVLPEQKKFQIKDRKYDDCYLIDSTNVIFETPKYTVKLSSSTENNYIQLYTPDASNFIAIEPMTGPSNSFNNNLGLKTLNAGENYHGYWNIQLTQIHKP